MHKIYRDFEDGAQITALGFDIVLSLQPLGELTLPSGKLIACDPFAAPETEPFSFEIAPGHYPVTLVCAALRDEIVCAYAVLELDEEPANRWRLAKVHEGEESVLQDDDEGFYVSSDVCCFMDARAANAYMYLREQSIFDDERDEITNELQSQLHRSRKRGPGWANVDLPRVGNIVAFDAGHGPGFYSAHLGTSHSGELRRVVIDFQVLDYRFPSFGPGRRAG